MSEKLITVYRHIYLMPVEIIKALLESHGINCVMKGADTTHSDIPFGIQIELQVQEKDKEKAEKIIKKAKTE